MTDFAQWEVFLEVHNALQVARIGGQFTHQLPAQRAVNRARSIRRVELIPEIVERAAPVVAGAAARSNARTIAEHAHGIDPKERA